MSFSTYQLMEDQAYSIQEVASISRVIGFVGYPKVYKVKYGDTDIRTVIVVGMTVACSYSGGGYNRGSILLGFTFPQKIKISSYPMNHTMSHTNYIESVLLRGAFPNATSFEEMNIDDLPEWLLSQYTSFHSDPIYIEATKLKYTDGTYNFARGNKTADAARKAAYNHLLNTYGTFYKGTEEELSSSYIQGLSSPDINGGGGN